MRADKPQPGPAHITAGGVFIPEHLAEPIWRVLLGEVLRRRGDGGRIRPDLAAALDVLRSAAMSHLSAHGHDARTLADIGAPSEPARYLTTAEMAARLRCSERHARRLAADHGVKPFARDRWDRADVAALEDRRP